MPARCSIVSGLYPHNHGYWMNFTEPPFPVEQIRLFQDLRTAGYRTGHVGKSHWFTPPFGQHYRAFDAYFEAIGLDHWVEIPGPHTPLDAPGEYAEMYNPTAIILPVNVPENEHDAARKRRANYYGKISHIDYWIGQIIDTIRKRGTWENTLVLFFADHGDYMGAHGRYGKCGFEDESARVPLILRWPDQVPADTRVDALVGILDIYPTLVGAAGGAVSPHRFGQDLLPVATGRAEQVHDAVFSEIGSKVPAYMVRTPQYKWFTQGPSHRMFLYDMESDPQEMEDLATAPEHKATVSVMRDRLCTFLMDTQVNFASTYRPLFNRVGVNPGTPGMADRLYAAMRSYQGLDS